MTLDTSAVGRAGTPVRYSWTERDSSLYALGIGAGADDLRFTTENSSGIEQQVLPTFPVLFLGGPPTGIGDYDPAGKLHAEQGVTLHRPLPPSGTVTSTTTVVAMHDKGADALVESETVVRDAATSELLATLRLGLFIRGGGGFGGQRGATTAWELPDAEPDEQVHVRTRPEQALVYRLSGDRNPLHSDPVFARSAGFDRPILHGLCTYGIAGRALLGSACDGDLTRFGSMRARFTKPVYPGDELTIQIWRATASQVLFRVVDDAGDPVLDRGVLTPPTT